MTWRLGKRVEELSAMKKSIWGSQINKITKTKT